jgi:hypothetical protein
VPKLSKSLSSGHIEVKEITLAIVAHDTTTQVIGGN